MNAQPNRRTSGAQTGGAPVSRATRAMQGGSRRDVEQMSADEFYGAPVQPRMRTVQQEGVQAQPFASNDGTYAARGTYDNDAPVRRVKHSRKSRRRRRRKRVGITIAVIVVVLILAVGACGGMLYTQAQDMKTDAKTVLAKVSEISTDISSNDYAAANTAALELKQKSATMNSTLNSPLWTVASILPVIGDDITAARTLGSVLDSVASNALVPLTQSLQANPPSSLISSGTVNVQALNTLASSIQSAAPSINAATKQLDSLPEMHIDQLKSMVTTASDKLKGINEGFQALSTFAPILSDLLGANGERHYLIVAQCNAELRDSGGFNGAYATMTIDNGKISLSEFGDADYIGDAIPQNLTTTDNERELFGQNYMLSAHNMNYNPDFARDAEIWAATYTQVQSGTVDGVIAVVPSVVQDMLAITGSITLSDGTVLDGTNATKILSHDFYVEYESAAENDSVVDDLFGEAAEKTFNKLLNNLNSSSLMKAAEVMLDDATSRKVMVWMADSDEEECFKTAGMSGVLNYDSTNPQLGVYVSTGMAAKIGWYIDVNTTIGEGKKNADGTISYTCTTTMSNVATSEQVENDGVYVMGSTNKGEPWPWLHIFAPAGGTITNFTCTQGGYTFKQGEYEGLQVMYLRADDGARLPAGSTISCTYTVTVAANATEELELSTTPTLTAYR